MTAYLKSKNRTYAPKKAKTLEQEQIAKFLSEAPNDKYLMMKLVLIMGVSGACRCEELTHLSINDIDVKEGYLLVTLPTTKTYKPRRFTVLNEGYTINVLELYQSYVSLRPKNLGHHRFFLNYRNNKCTIQPVGINTLSKVPKEVALFLNLSEPELYTGHCLRRSSATLLVNNGGDFLSLKRHGGWKSSTIAEGYVADSVGNKIEIAKKIMNCENIKNTKPSTVTSTVTSTQANTSNQCIDVSITDSSVSVENAVHESIKSKQFGGLNFHGNVQTVNIFLSGNTASKE